nr:hypothetical protein [Tanacetum cinerariifolium]
MGDTVAQTRSERVSKVPNATLLARVNTPRSGEDRLKINELMELCTNLQNKALNLETTKSTQVMEIESLKRWVKKLEKKKRSRTRKLKRLYKVGLSARVESSKDEDGDEVIVEDTNMLFDVADDLRGEEVFVPQKDPLKEVLNKGKGKMVEPEHVKKLSKKDQLKLDEELAFKLQATEEEEEERIAREKALQIKEVKIAWDDVQDKIDADYELAQRTR